MPTLCFETSRITILDFFARFGILFVNQYKFLFFFCRILSKIFFCDKSDISFGEFTTSLVYIVNTILDGNLLDSDACNIPHINPYDESITEFITAKTPKLKRCNPLGNLVYKFGIYRLALSSKIASRYGSYVDDLVCCYKNVHHKSENRRYR